MMQDAGPESAATSGAPRIKNEEGNYEAATAIYNITDSCFDILERLISGFDAECSLAPSDESFLDIRGLRNNFAFWIDYTGALADIGASLDDRLQGHDEIKEMVIELLQMVDRNLSRREFDTTILRILNGSGSYGWWLTSTTTVERGKDEDSAFRNTESQRCLSAIESALERLHFLAKAIRKASIQREPDLATFETDEDKFFHDMATAYVKWKCPNARPSLRGHMGDIIAARRRALLQKQRHARKLTTRRDAPKTATALKPARHQMASFNNLDDTTDSPAPGFGGAPPRLPGIADSKATRASKMDGNVALRFIYGKPTLSIRTSASSQQGAHMPAQYPDPPIVEPNERHVQCHYCLEPLPVAEMRKGTKNEYWR
jgi:hypothetical protein